MKHVSWTEIPLSITNINFLPVPWGLEFRNRSKKKLKAFSLLPGTMDKKFRISIFTIFIIEEGKGKFYLDISLIESNSILLNFFYA